MIRPSLLILTRWLLFATLALCAWPFAARAQTATATLSGIVVDQNGARVPGVEIKLMNAATSMERTATTTDGGDYAISLVPPGAYILSAKRDGFAVVRVEKITLNVGDHKSLDIHLKTGDVSETVNITGEAPLINESPAVGTTIDRQLVGNLPLNGRSFQSLILLTTGVTVAGAGGNGGVNDFGQFSVNGQRASTNYFTVDGVSANVGISTGTFTAQSAALAGAYPGLSAFGGTNSLVSVDALEEFRIQTSTYTAELGRQPGGQVSLVTRSGTNQFHGTAFEYIRNDALDARDYFNRVPAPKPALRQNQFGGVFSGPLLKNRTFFFFSYEGQRLRLPTSGSALVPSTRLRTVAAPAVRPLLAALPLPTGPELLDAQGKPTGVATYQYGVSSPSTLDAYSIRVDHVVNGKLTIFGRFNESPSEAIDFSSGVNGSASKANTRTLTLAASSVLSTRWNNEFRFNYSRQLGQRQSMQPTYDGAVPVDVALLTNGLGGSGAVNFTVAGGAFSVVGGDVTKSFQRQINIVDTVSWLKGAHQFKFGVDYRRLMPTYNQESVQAVYIQSENSVVNSIADFVSILGVEAARPQFSNLSTYGQDTWKVSAKFTLDLGLRWEVNPPPTLSSGRMPAVVTGIVAGNTPDVSKATLAPAGTPFYKTFYGAFAPRFGAAYHLLSRNGYETVIRGGFGVYYDLGSTGASTGFPLLTNKTLAGVSFPLSAANASRPAVTVPQSLPTTQTVFSTTQDLKLPYTLEWNFTIDQSLGSQQALSIGYVASAARRLLTTQQLNQVTSGPRPNPNFSGIVFTWNGPTSDYNSLQVQYRARFRRGFQALANYTWAHAIDEVSSDLGQFTLERGDANFDVRHNFSAAATYDLKWRAGSPILRRVFSNWSFDTIVHAQTGLPVSVVGTTAIVNGILVSTRPNYIAGQPLYLYDRSIPGGRRFNPAAFSIPAAGRQGTLGRNVLRQLPLFQIDGAVGRSFNISEKVKLQMKCEFFNLLNHPMFNIQGIATNYRFPNTFGVPSATLRNGFSTNGVAGLSSLYQLGGPRSIQISARLSF